VSMEDRVSPAGDADDAAAAADGGAIPGNGSAASLDSGPDAASGESGPDGERPDPADGDADLVDGPGGPGLRASLEAILLVVDEPVAEVVIAQVLERPRGEVAAALRDLAAS
jgi:hypothetical protein